MTRTRVRNAAAGFTAIVAFFAILAYATGFYRGKGMATPPPIDLSQDETPAPSYTPLTAQNDPHRIICDGGYGWDGHMESQEDVFCHPFFKAVMEEEPPAIVAAYRPKSPATQRNKPRQSLSNAVASNTARRAGLSQTHNSSTPDPLSVALALGEDEDNPPTAPGRFSLAPINPGFVFGGGGDGDGGSDSENPPSSDDSPDIEDPVSSDPPPTGDEPVTEDPVDNTPETPTSDDPVETPVDDPADPVDPPANPPSDTPTGGGDPKPPTPEDPEMPLPPLDPVDPDPVDPIDPVDPLEVPDPTVVPIPGAVLLWIPGLAALFMAAKRKRRLQKAAQA